jgi:prepilin-type N-terminal cleavage/methylation domain-containing protein/prepilin-type processing-associated H-X9-DG protein
MFSEVYRKCAMHGRLERFQRPQSSVRGRRPGFTVIELLTVTAIIGTLTALLLPAVQQAREAARRTQCRHHLRQLGIALHSYHDVHRTLPPGSLVSGVEFPLQTGWGWGAFILPQLEQTALYSSIDFHIGTAVGSNLAIIEQPVAIFHCPSDPAPAAIEVPLHTGLWARVAHGNYVGSEALFSWRSSVRFRDITDGLSQTWMTGEWTYSRSMTNGEQTASWCGTLADGVDYLHYHSHPHSMVDPVSRVNRYNTFHSRHPGGVNFLTADGAVHFISESLDRGVYYALSTPSGGEVVSPPF